MDKILTQTHLTIRLYSLLAICLMVSPHVPSSSRAGKRYFHYHCFFNFITIIIVIVVTTTIIIIIIIVTSVIIIMLIIGIILINIISWCVQVYSVHDSPLCLTGTAEVPLGAIYMDKILAEEQLPIKMAGFGHCFRTEAGAGGETAGRA